MQGRSFALVKVGRAGNLQTALTVVQLSRYFAPRLAVLIGMAGAAQKVKLGHIVIPSNVFDYDLSRLTAHGPQDESDAYDATASLVTYFTSSERTREWREHFAIELDSLYDSFKAIEMPDRETVDVLSFEVSTEPVMSGGLLFEDGSARKKAIGVNGRIVAVEMEGAGFAAACKDLGWSWRVVRGIADFGKPRRDKRWQRISTYGAALYVRLFFPPLSFFPKFEVDDVEDASMDSTPHVLN